MCSWQCDERTSRVKRGAADGTISDKRPGARVKRGAADGAQCDKRAGRFKCAARAERMRYCSAAQQYPRHALRSGSRAHIAGARRGGTCTDGYKALRPRAFTGRGPARIKRGAAAGARCDKRAGGALCAARAEPASGAKRVSHPCT